MAMKEIDLARVKDKEGLHFLLQESLDLPEYYGNNLDALWDCLTEIGTETELVFRNFASLENDAELKQYAAKFKILLEQAADENPCLKITLS